MRKNILNHKKKLSSFRIIFYITLGFRYIITILIDLDVLYTANSYIFRTKCLKLDHLSFT